jgi:hypothetical protein
MKRKIVWIPLLIVGLLAVLSGVYWTALAMSRPDESKLTAWGKDLDAAIAEAKQSGKLVLVKAGSEY